MVTIQTSKSASQAVLRSAMRQVIGNRKRLALCWMVMDLLFLITLSACVELSQAPVQIVPSKPPELSIEIISMEESVCIGDIISFKFKTTPGNECLGVISYLNTAGKWIYLDFEPATADYQGLCDLSWKVPSDAVPAEADFRARVRGYGTVSSTMPRSFRILACE